MDIDLIITNYIQSIYRKEVIISIGMSCWFVCQQICFAKFGKIIGWPQPLGLTNPSPLPTHTVWKILDPPMIVDLHINNWEVNYVRHWEFISSNIFPLDLNSKTQWIEEEPSHSKIRTLLLAMWKVLKTFDIVTVPTNGWNKEELLLQHTIKISMVSFPSW